MPQDFNKYQIAALQQLAEYKKVFATGAMPLTLRSKPVKGSKITIHQFIDSFIELFSQNHFADTDYSAIQNKLDDIPGMETWVKDQDICIILRCLTYAIWTDKTFQGYFLRKINDNTICHLLGRLAEVVVQNYRHQSLQRTKVTVISAPHAAALKKQ